MTLRFFNFLNNMDFSIADIRVADDLVQESV